MSEDFTNIAQEQGNIEAHEILMITNAMQCQTRCHPETLGQTYCRHAQANPRASDEVKEQFSNTSEGSQLFHTSRDRLQSAKSQGQTIILDQYLEDERYRVHLQSEGITKEK